MFVREVQLAQASQVLTVFLRVIQMMPEIVQHPFLRIVPKHPTYIKSSLAAKLKLMMEKACLCSLSVYKLVSYDL